MRMRLFAGVAAALLGLAPATPALAADDPGPVLTALSVSQHEVTVSGLDTVLVTVTAHIVDAAGVDSHVVFPDAGHLRWTPEVTFGSGDVAFLTLASGTVKDGIWSGQLPVTSRWNGTYSATRFEAEDIDYHQVAIDPATVVDVPTIVVHGSHTPAIQLDFLPDPAVQGKPVHEYIRVTDSATGQPLSFANLRTDADNGCVESNGAPARAGFWGTATVTVPRPGPGFGYCAWVAGADSFRPTPYPTIIVGVNHEIPYK